MIGKLLARLGCLLHGHAWYFSIWSSATKKILVAKCPDCGAFQVHDVVGP